MLLIPKLKPKSIAELLQKDALQQQKRGLNVQGLKKVKESVGNINKIPCISQKVLLSLYQVQQSIRNIAMIKDLKNKKITMATVKSFVKNSDKLYVENQRSFDGMVDCVMPCENSELREISKEDALGHNGAWVVGSSRDYFNYKEMELTKTSINTSGKLIQETVKYVGIEIENSCGSAILWTVIN
jgi:hypothetical protein